MVMRAVAAYQPGQPVDKELGPRAWATKLAPFDYQDAIDAVDQLAGEPHRQGDSFWFDLRDIIQVVGKIRRERAQSRQHLVPQPPQEAADDPAIYQRWLADTMRGIESRGWEPPLALPAPAGERSIPGPTQSLVKHLAQLRRI